MNRKSLIVLAILWFTMALLVLLTLISCTPTDPDPTPQTEHRAPIEKTKVVTTTAAPTTAPLVAVVGSHPDTIYFPKVPGAINPNVTQANIHSTVCVSGWTKTIRPAASYTTKLKIAQMAKYGLVGSTTDYEEDHLISLEIGGNPTDPNNLWPEPWNGPEGAHRKDVIETRLKRLVCQGTITLAEAQTDISTNWETAYAKYVTNEK